MTCQRTQGFLAKKQVTIETTGDAKKKTVPGKDAFAVLDGIDHLYASKGKKLVHFDLKKDQPSREEIAAVLIGPSGNLRAPTVRKGRVLLVGFNEEIYQRIIG